MAVTGPLDQRPSLRAVSKREISHPLTTALGVDMQTPPKGLRHSYSAHKGHRTAERQKECTRLSLSGAMEMQHDSSSQAFCRHKGTGFPRDNMCNVQMCNLLSLGTVGDAPIQAFRSGQQGLGGAAWQASSHSGPSRVPHWKPWTMLSRQLESSVLSTSAASVSSSRMLAPLLLGAGAAARHRGTPSKGPVSTRCPSRSKNGSGS